MKPLAVVVACASFVALMAFVGWRTPVRGSAAATSSWPMTDTESVACLGIKARSLFVQQTIAQVSSNNPQFGALMGELVEKTATAERDWMLIQRDAKRSRKIDDDVAVVASGGSWLRR